jgi:hypothetical protein
MPRVACQPFVQAVAATVFAFITLAAMLRAGAARDAVGTLPRYGQVVGTSDGATLVRAADDALPGRSSVTLPTLTTAYRREAGAAVVTLRPTGVLAGIAVPNAGGTVRILGDGRRVILPRE